MKREKEQERKEKEKQGMFWASMICFYKLCKLLSAFGRDIGQNGHRIPLLGGNRRKILFWALFAWLALSAVRYKRLGRSERGPLITGILLIAFLAGSRRLCGTDKKQSDQTGGKGK